MGVVEENLSKKAIKTTGLMTNRKESISEEKWMTCLKGLDRRYFGLTYLLKVLKSPTLYFIYFTGFIHTGRVGTNYCATPPLYFTGFTHQAVTMLEQIAMSS